MAERRKYVATDPQGEQMKRLNVRTSHISRDDTTRPKRRKALWRRVGRVLLIIALLLVLLAGAGLLYQSIVSAQDASSYPPPGKLIDIGGYRLHLYCTGASHPGSPTVILEEGIGATSLGWSKVQPGVASFTHVCSYDRAGYGWSDMGPGPRTDGHVVTELHMLLTKAGVPEPYVLVGHSSGGLIMRLYASTYPQEVVGLVLVDSSHEDQNRYPELRPTDTNLLPLCQALSPFGVLRLFRYLNDAVTEYPPAVQPAVKAQFYQTRYCQTVSDEEAAWDESVVQVRAARHPLGHLPLIVLTQGGNGKQVPLSWLTLQKDLVSLSTNSAQIIATRSGHSIHLDQPDLVIAAIKQVLTGKV
jgi:pimeloyl-ACP methyl ester carboxylesterase